MAVRYVKSDIIAVGAIDWDRRLFDKLIPLPHGTSYNSFVVKGSEKTALIDTSYLAKANEFFTNIDSLNLDTVDYVIANHAEPDHSGCIPLVLKKFPDAKVVTNSKCKEILISSLEIAEDKFIIVGEGDQISLGNKTLSFIIAPWVHWPDTMFTHVIEDKIIFTCDFMGSHLATSDLFVRSECEVYEPAKRYFAEIMLPFRTHFKKHLDKVKALDLEIIAPSHGPLYGKEHLNFIIKAHEDWISNDIKNEVIIPYVSMYENTEKLVRHLTDALVAKGIKVIPFNLSETDLGELAVSLVDATTIVMGASMVLSGPHPYAAYAAYIVNALRPKARFVSAIGSYGWAAPLGEKMGEQLKAMMPNLQAEVITPVFVKGLPKEETYKRVEALAEEIYNKHQQAMQEQ
jgi:flavorubredoxin